MYLPSEQLENSDEVLNMQRKVKYETKWIIEISSTYEYIQPLEQYQLQPWSPICDPRGWHFQLE